MDPEIQPPAESPAPQALAAPEAALAPEPLALGPDEQEYHGLRWIFIGPQGLRAGWSVTLFLVLTVLFMLMLGTAANVFIKQILHIKTGDFTPATAMIQEVILFLSLLGSGALMALLEQRRILDYNLIGPRRLFHFAGGAAVGFAGLSALVGGLAWGGWLHFGPVALSGAQILGYAVVWGVVFLLTGLFEEGAFRGYLQYTLTRGINFWWSLAIVAAICVELALTAKGQGVWGVYGIALLGLVPCLILQVKKVPTAPFWQAAWVTSTLFGFIHTGNNGENWIGIFAAAAIGFVFCVSIWVTGSAWWAIGFHAAWDWAETYFYGTADSGMPAQGHYLTTSPAGNALWSGGADGPESSALVLAAILLVLVALLVIYGRKRAVAANPALGQAAG